MAEQHQGPGMFNNLKHFLQHALDCSNPSCILPLCVNIKLTLQHLKKCKKLNCTICQEMKSLASKHSESCVDYHCRIPFCTEAKRDSRKRTQIDLSDCLDAIFKDNDTATTPRQQGCFESGRYSTANHTVAAPTSLSVFMDTYSPAVASSTMADLSAPLYKTPSLANLPGLCPDQSKEQSSINPANDKDNSPWCAFMEPFPSSQESTLATTTQERATPQSLVLERKARENAVENQHVLINLSSLSPPTQERNVASLQMSQNANKEIQELLPDHLNIACISSRAEKVSHTLRAMGFDCYVARDNKAKNTQTLLKARLFDALCSILRLIKHAKSTEELLMYIQSLKSALHEIKKLR